MKEHDDRMRAYQLTVRIQKKIEFYLNHTNELLHAVTGRTLIATNLELILVQKQLDQCKKRLMENNLTTETDPGPDHPFIPDISDYIFSVEKALQDLRDMEEMEKFPKH
tara:strand:- start:87 stop:413 length:327 start_codon:yes stop_codon:yes gene_type:complete